MTAPPINALAYSPDAVTGAAPAVLAVRQLRLTDFRTYKQLRLDCGPEPCTVIVPIKDYCLTAPNGRCPVCPGTPRGPSPVADCPYSMTFEGLEDAWTVSLSDTDGRPVAFDRVDTETATVVRVRPDAAHLVDSRPANYIIRFDARASMKPNAKYEVKTEIRLDPKPPGPGPAER